MDLPITQDYVDPVLSIVGKENFSSKTIQSLTETFPSYYSRITSNCSQALKIYKKLLNLDYELNSWEFQTLKTSININFNLDFGSNTTTTTRKFDIKIAKKVIERCNLIDDDINRITKLQLNIIIKFISGLTIQEYISDPGTLLLKVYFKILNLKNSLAEKISISYTKSKLLIISFELKEITDMIEKDENPLVNIDTDFQATLEGYKDFVTVLINQLDQAVQDKDSEQIQECLNILNDVEKMYESVRMNFFYTEEWNEWEHEQLLLQEAREEEIRQEQLSNQQHQQRSPSMSPSPSPSTILNDELYGEDSIISESPQYSKFSHLHSNHHNHGHNLLSRRGSVSSTTSSQATFNRHPTTISEELPYLLQAFDEAKQLEQELSTYQPRPIPTTKPSSSSSSNSSNKNNNSNNNLHPINSYDKKKSNLQTFNIPNVGFNNNLLNSIYGLSPKTSNNSPKIHHQSNLHNEVD